MKTLKNKQMIILKHILNYSAVILLLTFLTSCENDLESENQETIGEEVTGDPEIIIIEGKEYSLAQVLNDTELSKIYEDPMGGISYLNEDKIYVLEIFNTKESADKALNDFNKQAKKNSKANKDFGHWAVVLFDSGNYRGQYWATSGMHRLSENKKGVANRNVPGYFNDKAASLIIVSSNHDGKNSRTQLITYRHYHQRGQQLHSWVRGKDHYRGRSSLGRENDKISSIRVVMENK
ncbi:hypothetical protein [Aquimarina latercula]|uniref:hypothetical protein n=1 Tax=Aquimarina latercula TaxID=987 RepID=UPI00041D1AA7|nr:hypothetical protein [Aquimarina latercula]